MHDVAVQGISYILYNSELMRLWRADVQYTSPPTMIFAIGLSEVYILVIRLYIDLYITQVQELTLSLANMRLALLLIGSLFRIR